ncbi:MAG: hypothetical protein PHN38_10005 [Sulfurospirillaceae bacterium]|nr:hypothetical protein [Sulfurospirillaceae bacterium]
MDPLSLIIIGVGLVLLQIYIEVHMRTDDKYLSKKSTDTIVKELEEKKIREGKLTFLDTQNLYGRVFISKRAMLKAGLVLAVLGIALALIFGIK